MGKDFIVIDSENCSLEFASSRQRSHDLDMRCITRFRTLVALLALTGSAWAGIIDEVRLALARNNFSAAESALTLYRNQQGVTAEYLEAYSWMARAALEQGQYQQAEAYARQTKTLALEQ